METVSDSYIECQCGNCGVDYILPSDYAGGIECTICSTCYFQSQESEGQ